MQQRADAVVARAAGRCQQRVAPRVLLLRQRLLDAVHVGLVVRHRRARRDGLAAPGHACRGAHQAGERRREHESLEHAADLLTSRRARAAVEPKSRPRYPGIALRRTSFRPGNAPRRKMKSAADRRWLILAIVGAAFFMTILDVAIVNVALPSIERDLNVDETTVQ